MADRAILFLQPFAPYVAGDVAGFPDARAQDLVDRGVASFYALPGASAPSAASAAPCGDLFDAMDRAALIAYGRDHLGLTDDPPAEVTDAALRDALRAKAVEAAQAPAGDQAAPVGSAPADAGTAAKGKGKA